ncbi:hypothetical protein GCM10009530_59370 [Microbispora corallina]|uniref:Uncharacterized protein n=1 Tax=Microbispora corallina TaxID=83302 RepID=A0ABQ4GA67_9ACTN|nr:hypothetical protein Mco01_69880 [Microbispora corallina]
MLTAAVAPLVPMEIVAPIEAVSAAVVLFVAAELSVAVAPGQAGTSARSSDAPAAAPASRENIRLTRPPRDAR